jgi:hypothetical protein
VIVRCYLVLKKASNGNVTARRVARHRPRLDYDEAVIRLRLDLPDDAFEAPLITVQVMQREVAVAVEAEDPLVEEGAPA